MHRSLIQVLQLLFFFFQFYAEYFLFFFFLNFMLNIFKLLLQLPFFNSVLLEILCCCIDGLQSPVEIHLLTYPCPKLIHFAYAPASLTESCVPCYKNWVVSEQSTLAASVKARVLACTNLRNCANSKHCLRFSLGLQNEREVTETT